MKKLWILVGALGILASCKDKDPVITPDPTSEGKQVQLDGNAPGQTGASAGYSVYLDFSADNTDRVLRQSWDLGFYCDDEYRVIINNTTGAMAYVTDKTDINAVSSDDTVGVPLYFSLSTLTPDLFQYFDDVEGKISGTVIPEVKSNPDDNKVVIINRGTAGSIDPRDFYKVKVVREENGYRLYYAPLNSTDIKSAIISKDNNYNFVLFGFDDGNIIQQPHKEEWDIKWTISVYKTPLNETEFVPYIYSDIVEINYLMRTQVAIKEYPTAEEAQAAFEAYSAEDIADEDFVNDRWAIGYSWRRTAAPGSTLPEGTIKTRFYIVKDQHGNIYKVKFLSFSTADGGERGRPEIKYVLVK